MFKALLLEKSEAGFQAGIRDVDEASLPEGEATATVVCLHGFTGAKEDFLLALPELSARGYAAYAPDARGVHMSRSGGPFDLATLAADVVAVVESVRGPVYLVAHSFGGLVAQRAVVARPDLVAGLVLVCSGPAGFRASAPLIPITIERVTAFQQLLDDHDLADAWDLKTAHENVEMHPAMASFLRERFVAGSHAAAVSTIADALDADDVIDAVASSGVPTHVMYGERDGTWAQVTQNEMARRLGTEPTCPSSRTWTPSSTRSRPWSTGTVCPHRPARPPPSGVGRRVSRPSAWRSGRRRAWPRPPHRPARCRRAAPASRSPARRRARPGGRGGGPAGRSAPR